MGALRLNHSAVAFVVGVALATPVAAQESEPGDDLIRSQFSMTNTRSVTVGFFPTLDADDSAHQELLTGTAQEARVHVGELQVPPRFRSGRLEVDALDLPDSQPDDHTGFFIDRRGRPHSFELWLMRDGTSWTLEASRASADESASSDVVWDIPLTGKTVTSASPTLSAAVVPTADNAGLLSLRWGDYRWTATFAFIDPPVDPAVAAAAERPGLTDPGGRFLGIDADTGDDARTWTLAERNESAIVLPDAASSRIAIDYWKDQHVEHADFAAIASVAEGQVVRLTEAAVLRLRTMLPLQFGDVKIDTANLTPGFPGLYGLWLKRVGSGWRLVFSDEPDVWGTQHDPDFDAAEIDVAYYAIHEGSTRPLGVALVPTSARGGRLVIHWGPHEWSADFTIAH